MYGADEKAVGINICDEAVYAIAMVRKYSIFAGLRVAGVTLLVKNKRRFVIQRSRRFRNRFHCKETSWMKPVLSVQPVTSLVTIKE